LLHKNNFRIFIFDGKIRVQTELATDIINTLKLDKNKKPSK